MEGVKKYTRIVLNIIFPVAAVLLFCFLGPRLLKFFLPFVIGWVIAMIANPLVRFLERRLKIVRKHSSVMIVVVVLATIIGVLYLLISRLTIQAIDFARDLPGLYNTVVVEVRELMGHFEHLFFMLPGSLQETLNQFSNNIGEYLSLAAQRIASPTVEAAGNVAKRIPVMLVNAIVTILSSYFFIAERDRIMTTVRNHIPQGGGKYYNYLRDDVKRLIGGYFLAQFRIMFVVAAILAAGFLVLGVKYSLLLAVLIAILDFLPLFGTGTALFPWALIRLLSGDYPVAIGLILIYVLTQVTRQVIQPKIVGDSMGLSPLTTLLLLYLGFKYRGIAGMILAVPIGLIFINLYKYGAFDRMLDSIRILVADISKFCKEGDSEKEP